MWRRRRAASMVAPVDEGRPIDVGAQRPAGRTLPRHRTPEGQHLPTGARPEGVAVDDNRRLQRSQGARNPSSLGASASKKGRLDRHARREAKPRVFSRQQIRPGASARPC